MHIAPRAPVAVQPQRAPQVAMAEGWDVLKGVDHQDHVERRVQSHARQVCLHKLDALHATRRRGDPPGDELDARHAAGRSEPLRRPRERAGSAAEVQHARVAIHHPVERLEHRARARLVLPLALAVELVDLVLELGRVGVRGRLLLQHLR
eukprot:117974-Prymnesium_polylepis.1